MSISDDIMPLDIDLTGRRFPAEPLAMFQPCMTLAIDDNGRRFIAERGEDDGPTGPVWCVFPQPQVAVYVSDTLEAFTHALAARKRDGTTLQWLQGLTAQAQAVWALRRTLGQGPQARGDDSNSERVKQWLARLPGDARVYDLRGPSTLRGLPYGLGAAGRWYRCDRLPLFAITVAPTGQPWAEMPAEIFPEPPKSGAAGAMLSLQHSTFRHYRDRTIRPERLPLCA